MMNLLGSAGLIILINNTVWASDCERYYCKSETLTQTNNVSITLTEADIAEAVALGASTVDVLPDRGLSYIGMGVTNYGGEEAISATLATTTDNLTSMGVSAGKSNGGSDFLFKGYIGKQF